MTAKDIERRIKRIGKLSNDLEALSAEEHDLHVEFIEYIARGGTKNIAEKARLVLDSQRTAFPERKLL